MYIHQYQILPYGIFQDDLRNNIVVNSIWSGMRMGQREMVTVFSGKKRNDDNDHDLVN